MYQARLSHPKQPPLWLFWLGLAALLLLAAFGPMAMVLVVFAFEMRIAPLLVEAAMIWPLLLAVCAAIGALCRLFIGGAKIAPHRS